MGRLLVTFFIAGNFMLFPAANSYGKTMFVTDYIEITFRSGPGLENRIIGLLPSGTKLNVKDMQGDWCLVVPLDGALKDKEGWVLARYLTNSKPKALILQEAEKENASLKKKVKEYEEQVKTLEESVKKLTNELTTTKEHLEKIQNDYTLLRTESADFLNLKERFGKLQKEFSRLKVEKQRLMAENRRLKSSENLKWFVAGATVLLTGWLIGLIMGKRRKRRTYLY